MSKISALFFFALWTCAAVAQPDSSADQSKQKPLRDGASVAGVDGTLTKSPKADTWFFTLQTNVADDGGAMKEGQAVEMLRCVTLEKMLSIMKDVKADFRIWGRVTQFEGRNFIFPVYFLTISQVQPRDSNAPSTQKPISINEPNDVVKIPEEVLKKLKPQRTVELTQLSPTAGLEEDRMFSDRSGFVVRNADGSYVFKPDALGRNLQRISFAILPNDVLRLALDEQSHEPDRLRYKITGILTTYNGKNYILLQQAVPQYSYGNFAR
jgi:hypothetical protein